MVWYSHLFQNFPQLVAIHTVKGFGIVNKAEIDVFLEPSCFFDDPANVGNLISGSSAFSKTSLNIWNFTVHILLKPGLENFEHYFTSMWDECNCAVVWAFFGIVFLWNWNENWLFPGLLGIIEMFWNWIVVKVAKVCKFMKTHWIMHTQWVTFINVNYTSITLLKQNTAIWIRMVRVLD